MVGADAVIHLARLLFERLDRKYVESLHDAYDVTELEAKYSHSSVRRIFTAVFQILLFMAVNWALMAGAYDLIEQYARRDPDAAVVFHDSLSLFVAALTLGFVAACGLLACCELVRQRLKYRDRWHEYMAFKCMQFEFDVYRRVAQLFVIVGVPLLSLGAQCADTYALATLREVVLNPFLGFGESRYPFRQINKIEEHTFLVRDDQRKEIQTYHLIELVDGARWQSHDSGARVDPDDFRAGKRFVEYLSQQTGLPIEKAPPDP